ncbi:MAG: hypothetical protein ACMG50_05930 [Thermomonas sp.]
MTSKKSGESQRWMPWFLSLAGIAWLGQALLLGNPGYFSHDELQWAAFADTPNFAAMPWNHVLDIGNFQYRPVTFNLWLIIGRFLFVHPHAYHALWVALGTTNALLLHAVLRRWGLPARLAFAAALVFALNPFSAYVHGWVATLADLLWLAALLCIALLAVARNHAAKIAPSSRFAAIAGISTLALLSKESAVVIPAICALAWVLSPSKQHWRLATLASAIPTIIYLLMRVAIIDSGASGTAYAWNLWSIPERWVEYFLYAFTPTVFEPATILTVAHARLALAGLLSVGLLASVFRAHWRLGVGLLIGSLLILGPVLLLGFSAAQYGYAFSALLCGIGGASAWRLQGARFSSVWLGLLGLLAVLLVWHGLHIQRTIVHVGRLQSMFSPQLASLASSPSPRPLRMRSETDESWIYQRLSHEIPSYRGQVMNRPVQIVPPGQTADYLISADGTIHSLREGPAASSLGPP